MAIRKKKRGPSLDDKYLGPEPIFTEESEFTDSAWMNAAHWYNYFYKTKDYIPTTYQFAMDMMGYDKKKIAVLKRLKDWKFMKVNKIIKLYYRGFQYKQEKLEEVKNFINELYKEGLTLKKIEEKKKADVVVITPAERTRRKVLDTIYHDWDSTIVEGWFDDDFKQSFSCYNRFKGHGLKGNAINMFKDLLLPEYENIKAAYEKTCEDCIEGYSHISKGNKRKIMKQFEDVFDDLEKLRSSFKATKMPRAKKVKASDQQVSKLKYCQEDIDSKLTSINPVLIPTKHKLFVYNTKNRKLIQYTTSSISGFEISGTTIKNFDKDSKQATLRKPDEILPLILNKTEKQIEKVWETITTKIDSPTGRINADCILMRVF
jgi:hypothetical protein